MASCTQCGVTIPDGQTTCSMCYGDVEHGTDGIYRDWLEQMDQQEQPQDQS